MRTFLSRRYMRPLESMSRAEIAIGLFILLLLVAIVTAFALHTSTNKDYLFNTSDAALDARETPRATFVAGQLLPDLGDPAWKATGEARAMNLQDAAAIGGDDLAAFAVREAYTRSFSTVQNPEMTLDVLVCDVATPRQAFGLARTRQPATASSVSIGKNGWLDAESSRLGFWSGRYYTELRASGGDEQKEAMLERVARIIANTQLDYGGSFSAEAMLADEGADPGSLRYFHTSAFGFDGLDEVFAATKPDGIAIWIVDAGSASGALRVFKKIESNAETTSTPTIRRKDAVTALVLPGQTLALFTYNRYVRGAYGPDEKATLEAALSIHESLVMNARQTPPTQSAIDDPDAAPLPDPGVVSWEAPRTVDRFTAETLYEKIDGRADAYLQFKVVELTFGTYFHTQDAERTVDVYAYDMGEPANAYGIYRTEASPGAESVAIGKGGYRVDGAIFFHKGSRYVQVLPNDPQDAETAQAIAESIAATIDQAQAKAGPENLLPTENRVPDSLTFIAQDAFGLGFLSNVYAADYAIGDTQVTLFVLQAAGSDDAQSLLARYEKSFTSFGRVLWKDNANQMLAGEAAGLVDVVFVKGAYLAGVAGADDADIAKKQAIDFSKRLSNE